MNNENSSTQQTVVAEEVAIKELADFASYHLDEEVKEDTIKEKYGAVLKAIMRGNLDLSEIDKPVLKLSSPVMDDKENVDTATIEFKTRIKPTAQQGLMRGIDIQKDLGKYLIGQTAHLCNFSSPNYLDKLSKRDYKVIEQITNLFM